MKIPTSVVLVAKLTAVSVVLAATLGQAAEFVRHADPRAGDAGAASVAGAPTARFKIRGHVKQLYPGKEGKLRLRVTNPNGFPIVVRTIKVKVRPAGRWCSAKVAEDTAVPRNPPDPRAQDRDDETADQDAEEGRSRLHGRPVPTQVFGEGDPPVRRRLALLVTIVALLSVAPGVALAAWQGAGGGQGYAKADALPVGGKPTVSVLGRNVTLTWGASTFAVGTAVDGYVVTRYNTSNVAQTVGAGCAGTVAALTCTEAAVPSGTWTYTVRPKQGAWTGAEGPRSANAVVGTAALSLTPTVITSLPATLNGNISNFITGQTVTWRLDDPTTGMALSGSTTPVAVPAGGGATATVTIPGSVGAGSHIVYAVDSSGDVASQAVNLSDTSAPSITAAAIGKTAGGATGSIHQGSTYYVYANVVDPPPTAGLASVTANVTTVTTGSTTVALGAGSYTAGGVSYNYRSASLTASNPLSAGSKTFTITATDALGHAMTGTGFAVTVDNTAPAGSTIQTANTSGGTAGRAETGDTITYTFTEAMDPNSILAGWDGTAAAVTLRLVQSGNNDQVQIFDAGNVTALNLGTVSLGRNYVTGTVNFAGSTMVLSGSTVTVTLGTPDGSVRTVKQKGTMTWVPSASATDLAGNACNATTVTESGANDNEF